MWETNTEFILSVISYGVGLGNLWRFPYLCAKHGGISFLVPYWTCLIFCGLPLCILENTIGQFSGKSPVMLFKNFPIFKGVGWAMMAVDFGGNFQGWCVTQRVRCSRKNARQFAPAIRVF